MPFGDFKDFADCVIKNKDKENPEAYCADLHKKITGEWPSAVKGIIIEMVADYLDKNPEADVSVKTVEGIIDRFGSWDGDRLEDFDPWKLTGPALSGPIVVKSSLKRIVVGPVLIPGEADHEGETLTAEKIEDVAYQFMSDFRYIDLAHTLKQVGIPVSSDILRQPESHVLKDGSKLDLPKGTWMLGVKVEDPATWLQIEAGAMKGFSIMGVSRKTLEAAGKAASMDGLPLGTKIEGGKVKKILLSDLGPDWVAVAVSILPNPSVFKSKFIAIKEAGSTFKERITRFLRFSIKGNPDQKSDDDNKQNSMEEKEMEPKDVQEMIDKELGPVRDEVRIVMDEIKKLTPKTADPDPDKDKESETPVPPPPADLKAQVDKVAGEVEAVKGTLTEINKSLKTLSAVKSQGLPQDGNGNGNGNPAQVPGPNRDVFGRAKK